MKIIPLPPQKLRFMNEDDEKFIKIGNDCYQLLIDYGFNKSSSILDIGSGYGRLAYAIFNNSKFDGKYVGVDILPKHIDWCKNNITPYINNVVFELLDIKNDRYNPAGKIDARNIKLNFNDSEFEFCSLFSVFTHMFEDEIKNYLKEIYRIIKKDGFAIVTFFLLNKKRMNKVVNSDSGLTMKYALNEYTRYYNKKDKLHAISYDENFVFSLIKNQGFSIEDCIYGHWAGGNNIHYQDTIIIRR